MGSKNLKEIFELMRNGKVPRFYRYGILVMILLMNTLTRNSKLHGKMEKVPCFESTLKI